MAPYSLKDIELYLRGQLSSAEMHAMEKAALQDPFLADAIEGYRSAGIATVNEDLSSIHHQLDTVKEVPVTAGISVLIKSITWLQAAASIILVAGATTLGWVLLKTDTKENTAVHAVAAGYKKDTIEKDIVAVLAKKAPAKNQVIPTDAEAEVVAVPKMKGYDTTFRYDTNITRKEVLNIKIRETPLKKTLNIKTAEKNIDLAAVSSAKITEDEIAKIKTGDSLFKIKKDSTVLARLSHMPGIQVDKNGNITAQGQPLQKVLVDADEFFGDDVRLRPVAAIKDTVVNGAGLNDVVIVGYGTNRKKGGDISLKPLGSKTTGTTPLHDSINIYFPPAISTRIAWSSVKTAPATGWPEFNRYLSEKLSLVQSDSKAPYDSISVMVSIEKDGKVQYAGITRTFNNSLNSRVSKAILEGPHWVNVSGRNESFSLVIAVYR